MTITSKSGDRVLGTATILTAPKRVVSLDSTAVIDTALSLHVPLVGVPSGISPTGLYGPQLAAVATIGARPNWDYEKIAALHPDLIVGLPAEFDQNFDKFGAIAPAVALPESPPSGSRSGRPIPRTWRT